MMAGALGNCVWCEKWLSVTPFIGVYRFFYVCLILHFI
jgi:hypothetical protein